VQPRASVTEIMGLQGNEIRIRVAAPPVDGAANEALAGGRSKTVVVIGLTPDQAARRLGLPPASPEPA